MSTSGVDVVHPSRHAKCKDGADLEWRAAFEFEFASNTRIKHVRESVDMSFVRDVLVFLS